MEYISKNGKRKYIMNLKKLENFLCEGSCGCELTLNAFARCEDFCSFFELSINVPEKEVKSVEVTVEVYTEPSVRLTDDRKKAIEDKARGIALDLIDRAGVNEDDIGFKFSVKYLIEMDEYENEKMFALCTSRSWKAFDY